MLRSALAALMVTSVVGSFASVESIAVFSDSKALGANTFSTGSVSITLAPATALVTFANMAPGDFIIAPLTLSNGGTLQHRYAMTTGTTNADGKSLGGQLVLTVREYQAPGCSAETGAVLYTGALSGGIIGSNVQGAHAGDRVLNAAANEQLCFKVQLPLATGNAFQTATTTATFTFDAEQTVNNP